MKRETTVRFRINAGLWRAFKGASMIHGKKPFDELRRLIKGYTGKRIRGVRTKR